MTVTQVMKAVLADKVFYDHSGGGVTISGGEPLAHADFTRELLAEARLAGVNTCVETSGYAPWTQIESLIHLVDLWLWDVKAPPELHETLVGVPCGPIVENLRRLDSTGGKTVLRCPLIPGVNDSDEALRHIASIANSLNHLQWIDLEPYHPLGETKNARLGKTDFFQAPFPAEETKAHWQDFLARLTRVHVKQVAQMLSKKQ